MEGPMLTGVREVGATEADLDHPLSFGTFLGYLDQIITANKALKARVTELENRVKVTEVRAMRFRGVHQTAEEYQRGDLTTFKGALWHANRSTTERPGDSPDWQLAVKSGAAS